MIKLKMELSNEYDDKTTFSITFHEGYSFRHLIEFFKKIGCTQIDLFVSEKGIYIAETNENMNPYLIVEIYANQLVEYKYNSLSGKTTMITIGIDDLYVEVQNVPKKKALKIYKSPNDPLHLRIQKLDSYRTTDVGGTIISLAIRTKAKQFYTEPRYNIKSPVCVVPISNFSDTCKEFSTYDNVILKSSKEGVIMLGMSNGLSKPKCAEFGNFNMNEEEEPIPSIDLTSINLNNLNLNAEIKEIVIQKPNMAPANGAGIKLRSEFIKSLMKLNNISPGGVLQFYIEKESINGIMSYKPLFLSCNVGAYGRMKIYVS